MLARRRQHSQLFVIQICDIDKETTHLPIKNSKVIKFLLDRGARGRAVLVLTNYCLSPLVQGALEIPCRVEISMPPTKRTKR